VAGCLSWRMSRWPGLKAEDVQPGESSLRKARSSDAVFLQAVASSFQSAPHSPTEP